jgi:hypothetical protein
LNAKLSEPPYFGAVEETGGGVDVVVEETGGGVDVVVDETGGGEDVVLDVVVVVLQADSNIAITMTALTRTHRVFFLIDTLL